MFTFNKFTLRKNINGQLWLDLELNLLFAPQKTLIRLSIPASPDYKVPTHQPLTEGDGRSF